MEQTFSRNGLQNAPLISLTDAFWQPRSHDTRACSPNMLFHDYFGRFPTTHLHRPRSHSKWLIDGCSTIQVCNFSITARPAKMFIDSLMAAWHCSNGVCRSEMSCPISPTKNINFTCARLFSRGKRRWLTVAASSPKVHRFKQLLATRVDSPGHLRGSRTAVPVSQF